MKNEPISVDDVKLVDKDPAVENQTDNSEKPAEKKTVKVESNLP